MKLLIIEITNLVTVNSLLNRCYNIIMRIKQSQKGKQNFETSFRKKNNFIGTRNCIIESKLCYSTVIASQIIKRIALECMYFSVIHP